MIKLSTIKANPSNPRTIKDDKFKKLVQSIKDFPKMMALRPIVVDKDGIVQGGNMRLKALIEAGYKEVPEEWIARAENFTEDELREFIVKDNVSFGEWNWEDLANDWDQKELIEWGLDIPDFAIEAPEATEDDYEIPDTIETDIVLGDLFEIGPHRLLCGDNTDTDGLERLFDGSNPNVTVTDPPYGIGIDGQKLSVSSNPKHNRKHHEFRGWDNERPSTEIFNYLLALDIPTVVFGGNYFSDLLPASRGWIYWSKGQDGLTMSDGELAWTNLDKPLRCVTVNRANLGKTVHPTQKPVQVIDFAIKYAEGEGIAFDPFLGSGTTMVSSHQLKMICYGIELDPKYCQVIIDRMLKLDPSLKITRNGEPYMPINKSTEKAA